MAETKADSEDKGIVNKMLSKVIEPTAEAAGNVVEGSIAKTNERMKPEESPVKEVTKGVEKKVKGLFKAATSPLATANAVADAAKRSGEAMVSSAKAAKGVMEGDLDKTLSHTGDAMKSGVYAVGNVVYAPFATPHRLLQAGGELIEGSVREARGTTELVKSWLPKTTIRKPWVCNGTEIGMGDYMTVKELDAYYDEDGNRVRLDKVLDKRAA